MPRLSAWFVRLSLLYLGVGFSLGAVMLANEGCGFLPDPERYQPAHVEILMVGWMLQLALGVAYWILPRNPGGQPRGKPWVGWAALALVNAGILLVVASVLVEGGWFAPVGRVLEIIGILVYLSVMWRRVRPTA